MGQTQPGKQEIVPVQIASGFISDTTIYAAGGRWWNGDGVRFRKGNPEKIGGWTRLLAPTWTGTPRSLFVWSDLTARNRLALGTTAKAYAYDFFDGTFTDITPTGVSPFDVQTGWGTGGWGEGGWGSSPALSITTVEPAMWSFDNWGEDLILNARGLGIYYYDVTSPSSAAVNISTLGGATDTPAAAIQVLVDAELRFVIALGASPIGSSVRDPMFIRWADRGSVSNWSVSPSTTAGGFRLSSGSRILCGVKTRREILVFTDTTLYSLQATGGTSIFRPTVLAQSNSLVGPNAQTVDQGDTVYWMAKGNFYRYNGRVEVLPCDITDRVFDDINYGLGHLVTCGMNPKFDEVWWFYPSANATENDRYVAYNYAEQTWTNGTVLKRSAWFNSPFFDNPIAASASGVYLQENGFDNMDTGSAVAIPTYIQSAPTEVDDGNFVLLVDRVIPDVSYGVTPTALTPTLTYTLPEDERPLNFEPQSQGSQVAAGVSTQDYRAFTPKVDIRVRGRKFGLRIDNNQLGVFWRLGRQRVRVKIDGQR